MDVVALDRRAVLLSVGVVAAVRDDQWGLPTPCSEWTVRRLVEHMAASHLGFATAAGGETEDTSAWEERPLGGDPRGAYAGSAERVVEAFGRAGVLDGQFWIPVITTARTFPAPQAVSFHFIDFVAHAWDVAVSVGAPLELDDDLVAAAMEVTRREVPEGPFRELPGASFRPVVPVPEDAPTFDRVLGLLGRDPAWRP